jgi:hypothetical protein
VAGSSGSGNARRAYCPAPKSGDREERRQAQLVNVTMPAREHPGRHPSIRAVEMAKVVVPDLMGEGKGSWSIRGTALDRSPGHVHVGPGSVNAIGAPSHRT